jgi:hypothetical protein
MTPVHFSMVLRWLWGNIIIINISSNSTGISAVDLSPWQTIAELLLLLLLLLLFYYNLYNFI